MNKATTSRRTQQPLHSLRSRLHTRIYGPVLGRNNFAGRRVSLLGGIVLASQLALTQLVIAKSSLGQCGALTGLGESTIKNRKPLGQAKMSLLLGASAATAGACGLVDDLDQNPDSPKGLRGHLGALKKRRITTGTVKIVILGLTALSSAYFINTWSGAAPPAYAKPSKKMLGALLRDTALIGALTNLHNLLDLRPGRALKASLFIQLATAFGSWKFARARAGSRTGPGVYNTSGSIQPARYSLLTTALATLSALPTDLKQKTMLGDTGANALGMVVGINCAALLSEGKKNFLTLVAVGLNLASEKVSFSRVIASVGLLDRLDKLGTDRS